MTTTHPAGAVIRRREVLHGQLWMDHPVTVVADDGDVLAVWLEPGSRFTFHDHPFAHPWRHHDAWGEAHVLQLHREGDLYSVWKFFHHDVFTHWYINFEAPIVRQPDGFDTDDYGLDLVIALDGTRTWKDVDHLNSMLHAGRMTERQVLDVLAAAEDVTRLLDRDERWWSPWDLWVPLAH